MTHRALSVFRDQRPLQYVSPRGDKDVPVIVEVETNENCEAGCFVRFKEARPPRPVRQIRLYDRDPSGEWCWITGWSDTPEAPSCPAYARLVEDSGAGLAFVVYGGLYGLRFRPITIEEPWSLQSPNQWGEAYLLLADERDIRYGE